MSLKPEIVFGLRLARLIVETGRHPFDRHVKGDLESIWMMNGLMDDGDMDDPVAWLLMRKTDGALFRLAEGQEEPAGDFWRFQWPQDSKHQLFTVLHRLNEMAEGKQPVGDITL